MTQDYSFSLTQEQHEALYKHLSTDDQRPKVAIVFCGQANGQSRFKFLAKHIVYLHQNDPAIRCPQSIIDWVDHPLTRWLATAIEEKYIAVKISFHSDGFASFTALDDEIDHELLPWLSMASGNISPTASLVMLPDGQMFGRTLYAPPRQLTHMTSICVVGDDLKFWYNDPGAIKQDFTASHGQIFGKGTTERLQKLSIAIVGCSGTGSPLAEQLARLGVKRLTLIDDDIIEERNLNRIYGSKRSNAVSAEKKVHVIKEHIENFGLETEITAIPSSLWSSSAIKAVAEADIVFGCMDTIDGRFLLNKLCSYYLIPYFDIGIRLDASPHDGTIREVCGTIHYLQPHKSSLLSRGLFSLEDVRVSGLKRIDPDAYQLEVEEGYIRGVVEDRPAVISINTLGASLALNEMLSRLHPYREQTNDQYAQIIFSLASMEFLTEPEEIPCLLFSELAGTGDTTPLLNMPELSYEGAV